MPNNILQNSDANLKDEASSIVESRTRLGLEGLVGDLEFVIINTEPERQKQAALELLNSSGLECREEYEDETVRDLVLSREGSADIIIRARKSGANPFVGINSHSATANLPNTRLETLVFNTEDIERYVSIQKNRGVKFLTNEIQKNDKYSFIQTVPSVYTGNSVGFVEWRWDGRSYAHAGCKALGWRLKKQPRPYLSNVKQLDHIATRLTARDRDPAIIEFMKLTNYNFDKAFYIENLNSITSVTRYPKGRFALVFTSGIDLDESAKKTGPTENFVANYGARVHHMAFHTENIEETYAALERDGMHYLISLVGSPEEGLKQTFTVPFENTMIVNEYIYRYGDFDGFFTKSNVTLLTEASGKVLPQD